MMFIGFNSTKKMLEWVASRKQDANAMLAPAQQEITWGSFWARFDQLPAFVEWGYVMNEAENLADLLATNEPGGDPQEMLSALRKRHDEGFMFGKAYSLMSPSGEYGETHRSNMWPVESHLFAAAQQSGWDHQKMALGDRLNLSITYEEWKAHLRELMA